MVLLIVFLMLFILVSILMEIDTNKIESQKNQRISNLKVGDEFVEVEWGKKTFKIKEISNTGMFVKLNVCGSEIIEHINSFKNEEVYICGDYYKKINYEV